MTIKDLIRILQNLDDDMEIVIGDGRLLVSPYKDKPERIYVLPIEELLESR